MGQLKESIIWRNALILYAHPVLMIRIKFKVWKIITLGVNSRLALGLESGKPLLATLTTQVRFSEAMVY